ncbi:MAG: amino acid ABC transporter permease [Spirochaetales bacterium]|nr:amino acid ABC transporter permease [Spirochaetales bacterium]
MNIMFVVRKTSLIESLKYLLFLGVMTVLISLSIGKMEYNWQWYRIWRYIVTSSSDGSLAFGPLLKGLAVTIKISVISLFFAFIIGIITALFRLSTSFAAKFIARVYLELIRNTPLLIQLFVIYFVISPVFNISPFVSAVLSLSLFEGAYASEIIRGGIISIPKGQWESAYSLGLNTLDTYRFVVIPQTMRQILPPLTGQAVSLIKDSALVSTIAIYDLTMAGQAIISETFLTFEIWLTVAAIYLIMTVSISSFVHYLEKRNNYSE